MRMVRWLVSAVRLALAGAAVVLASGVAHGEATRVVTLAAAKAAIPAALGRP